MPLFQFHAPAAKPFQPDLPSSDFRFSFPTTTQASSKMIESKDTVNPQPATKSDNLAVAIFNPIPVRDSPKSAFTWETQPSSDWFTLPKLHGKEGVMADKSQDSHKVFPVSKLEFNESTSPAPAKTIRQPAQPQAVGSEIAKLNTAFLNASMPPSIPSKEKHQATVTPGSSGNMPTPQRTKTSNAPVQSSVDTTTVDFDAMDLLLPSSDSTGKNDRIDRQAGVYHVPLVDEHVIKAKDTRDLIP